MTPLPSPSTFYPELSSDRLATVAELLLDVRFSTLHQMDSPFDDAYTRESAIFGRCRNALIDLCLRGNLPWLTLASPTMDVTFRIGTVPCRFFRDDPKSPDKTGFFKRNVVDDLFAAEDSEPLIWRFVVERAFTEEEEDRVFFIGYNAYHEPVSMWAYSNSEPVLHSVDNVTPAARELEPAIVEAREDRAEKRDEAQNE